MKRFVFAVLALAGALLVGCGGGGGSRVVPNGGSNLATVPNPAVPANLQIANWGAAAMHNATYVGPVTNATLSVMVQVHQQNAMGLVQYAQSANDPSSPNFRKWLTPQEIAQRFGASTSDYLAVAKYFAQNGLAVMAWPQRLVLSVSGSQTNLQRAFNTTFGTYQRNGQQFVAPRTAPYFSQPLPVDAIGHIVALRREHTFMIPGGPRAGAGYGNGFSPSTIQAAQDFSGAYSAGYNGSGVTIGIIGTGPIDTIGTPPYDQDLKDFEADTNATVANVTFRLVSDPDISEGLNKSGINPQDFPYAQGFTQTPGPNWGANNEDGEAQLDTQQAASLAPDANVYFYFGYNPNDGCTDANFSSTCPAGSGSAEYGIQESDAEIQQAIGENDADVISMSFGEGEYDPSGQGAGAFTCYSCTASATQTPYVQSYSQLEFAELAAEGIAVFASSGDSGSSECFLPNSNSPIAEQCVTYPAGDPNVTSVGGVTLNVDASGQITAPWLAWGITTSDIGYGGYDGSGGGTSTIIPANSQSAPWQATVLGATMREQPDVSMDGDPSTGVAMVSGGQLSIIGGTSVAAPDMAAMWADVLSACKEHPSAGWCPSTSNTAKTNGHYWRLGNASPYLYAIYSTDTNSGYAKAQYKISGLLSSLTYTDVFYDIVYGDNQMYPGATPAPPATPAPTNPVTGYQAGTGYDEVTGVGVPFAGHLIDAILDTTSVP